MISSPSRSQPLREFNPDVSGSRQFILSTTSCLTSITWVYQLVSWKLISFVTICYFQQSHEPTLHSVALYILKTQEIHLLHFMTVDVLEYSLLSNFLCIFISLPKLGWNNTYSLDTYFVFSNYIFWISSCINKFTCILFKSLNRTYS